MSGERTQPRAEPFWSYEISTGPIAFDSIDHDLITGLQRHRMAFLARSAGVVSGGCSLYLGQFRICVEAIEVTGRSGNLLRSRDRKCRHPEY
jgi:hypothetical protein